jgi:hypothetical protein
MRTPPLQPLKRAQTPRTWQPVLSLWKAPLGNRGRLFNAAPNFLMRIEKNTKKELEIKNIMFIYVE